MSIKGKACIVGAYEHPTRKAADKSLAQLHAEVAAGALADAGLTKSDIDGYFCASEAINPEPLLGPMSLVDFMGLRVRHVDSTETGGSSFIHVAHAAQAIALGKCTIALMTLAGRPRSERWSGTESRIYAAGAPEPAFESPYGMGTASGYGMVASRHRYEFGTTGEQLAWIKVAASHNPTTSQSGSPARCNQ
jgi:acetyl-CoA C-acetyltransferase